MKESTVPVLSERAGNREKVMPLENYLDTVAFVARSLADENRLRILLCVHAGKKSVSAIVEELSLSQPLVSHHLKELRRALLVKVERGGPFVYYEIADARILEILAAIRDLATDLLAARTTFWGAVSFKSKTQIRFWAASELKAVSRRLESRPYERKASGYGGN